MKTVCSTRGQVATSRTPQNAPLYDARYYPPNTLDCSPTLRSELELLAAPEGGSRPTSSQPFAPVDVKHVSSPNLKLGLWALVRRKLWSPRSKAACILRTPLWPERIAPGDRPSLPRRVSPMVRVIPIGSDKNMLIFSSGLVHAVPTTHATFAALGTILKPVRWGLTFPRFVHMSSVYPTARC